MGGIMAAEGRPHWAQNACPGAKAWPQPLQNITILRTICHEVNTQLGDPRFLLSITGSGHGSGLAADGRLFFPPLFMAVGVVNNGGYPAVAVAFYYHADGA